MLVCRTFKPLRVRVLIEDLCGLKMEKKKKKSHSIFLGDLINRTEKWFSSEAFSRPKKSLLVSQSRDGEVSFSAALYVRLYLCLFSSLLSVWIGPTLMRGIFLGKSYGKKKNRALIVKACSILFLCLCVCVCVRVCVCVCIL